MRSHALSSALYRRVTPLARRMRQGFTPIHRKTASILYEIPNYSEFICLRNIEFNQPVTDETLIKIDPAFEIKRVLGLKLA